MLEAIALQLAQIKIAIASLAMAIAGLSGGGDVDLGGIAEPIEIPSTVAVGETIDFNFTDSIIGENFSIRTDQEVYTPLWAWNGFDVYVWTKNQSEDQNINFQPLFSDTFVVEEISVLDADATTTIIEPIYEEICETATATKGTATGVICHTEKTGETEKIVSGVWEPVELNASAELTAYSLKDEITCYKLRVKSVKPFSQEEFDLRIVGDKNGFGYLDPTILTEDFESCLIEDLDTNAGCTGWSGGTGFDAQDSVVFEGANAVVGLTAVGGDSICKTGTARAAGKVSFYMRVTNDDDRSQCFIRDGETQKINFYFHESGGISYLNGTPSLITIEAIVENTYYSVEIEFDGDYLGGGSKHRYRINDMDQAWSDTWDTAWVTTFGEFTDIDTVCLVQQIGTGGYWDHIAEEPYAPAVAVEEPAMEVFIIGG